MPDRIHFDEYWFSLAGTHPTRNVEVFVDGSMRYPVTALDVAFFHPKTLQTASYAQGGILFRFDPTSPIAATQQDVTIIAGDEPTLNLLFQAFIEFYTILLALHCSVQVANIPAIFENNPAIMGRDYLLTITPRNLGI